MAEKTVVEKALKAAIDKTVGDKLAEVARNFWELTKQMSESEKLEYKKLVLEDMTEACNVYFAKMSERIIRQ